MLAATDRTSVQQKRSPYWIRPTLMQFLTALEDETYTVEDALHLGLMAVVRRHNERLKQFICAAEQQLRRRDH